MTDPTKPMPDDEQAPAPETTGVGEDPGVVLDPDETVPAEQVDDPPTRGQYGPTGDYGEG